METIVNEVAISNLADFFANDKFLELMLKIDKIIELNSPEGATTSDVISNIIGIRIEILVYLVIFIVVLLLFLFVRSMK